MIPYDLAGKIQVGSMIPCDPAAKTQVGSMIPYDLAAKNKVGSMIPVDLGSKIHEIRSRIIFSDHSPCLVAHLFPMLSTALSSMVPKILKSIF